MTHIHHALNNTAPVAPAAPAVGLRKSLWWMVFLADTVTLSMVLKHFKNFTLSPGLITGGWLTLSVITLILFTGALVYDGYAREKQKGKLKNSFGLFEWIYAQQAAPNNHLGDHA